MKKITILFTLLLAVLLVAPKVQAAPSGSAHVDGYTQVYDKGNGNYRLVLQTDTQKSQGETDYVFAQVVLNPLINVTAVSASYNKSTATPQSVPMDASYDSANHEVIWKLKILDENPPEPEFGFDPVDGFFFIFPDEGWPDNVLIIDFTIDDDVYGDILVFESVSYTVDYQGSDSVYESTFYFWQNAVRVEAPNQPASVNLELFKDAALSEAKTEVAAYDEDVFVKITIKNPNNQALKGLGFSTNHDILNLVGTTAGGQTLDTSKLEEGNSLALFDLEGLEELVLTGQINSKAAKFYENSGLEQADFEVFLETSFPEIYELDLHEEDILNSGSYVVLKTEDQMMDPDFQAPIIDDEDQNWVEGLPFKTNFEYDLALPQSLVEGESALDSDLKSVVLKEKEEEVDQEEEIDIDKEEEIEEEIIEDETEAPEEEGEVLGDEDEVEIPEMGDNDFIKYGFILFFIGVLTVMFSKKEEVL